MLKRTQNRNPPNQQVLLLAEFSYALPIPFDWAHSSAGKQRGGKIDEKYLLWFKLKVDWDWISKYSYYYFIICEYIRCDAWPEFLVSSSHNCVYLINACRELLFCASLCCWTKRTHFLFGLNKLLISHLSSLAADATFSAMISIEWADIARLMVHFTSLLRRVEYGGGMSCTKIRNVNMYILWCARVQIPSAEILV